MIQTRDKITASMAVAATVAFASVIAPTSLGQVESYAAGPKEAPTQSVMTEKGDIVELPDAEPVEVIDKEDASKVVIYSGEDAKSTVSDEGADGLGDSEEIIVAVPVGK